MLVHFPFFPHRSWLSALSLLLVNGVAMETCWPSSALLLAEARASDVPPMPQELLAWGSLREHCKSRSEAGKRASVRSSGWRTVAYFNQYAGLQRELDNLIARAPYLS